MSQNTSTREEDRKLQNSQSSTSDLSGEISTKINSGIFDEWYKERQRTQNVREGQAYLNTPPDTTPAKRHSPSKLLQCPRRSYYRSFNAPEEAEGPSGLFWFGSLFETELAIPFLEDVTSSEQYVQNSLWVDFVVSHSGTELRFKGETDPAIVTESGKPKLLTELKTTTNVGQLEAPKQHHKAQLHAYLYGLRQKYDERMKDGLIIYTDRKTLDMRCFDVEFDADFWKNRVLRWAANQTRIRRRQSLPDAQPRVNWECNICSFSERCGQGSMAYEDVGAKGLLPLHVYPRDIVLRYLKQHEQTKLTPTLAHEYPDLVAEHGVHNWECPVCGTEHDYESIDWSGDIEDPPKCTQCASRGYCAELRGPLPVDQPEQIETPEKGEEKDA